MPSGPSEGADRSHHEPGEATDPPDRLAYARLTAKLLSHYVRTNPMPPDELPALVGRVCAAFAGSKTAHAPPQAADGATTRATPVQIRRSITPDALISFIDGKPYKTLKRHLAKHGLDLDGYRARYGLPDDYPSSAASFSAQRSALATSRGFGQLYRRRGQPAGAAGGDPAERPQKRRRRSLQES